MIFGPILGPILGGFIIQGASWRWIFFINVFIGLIAAPPMMKKMPNFEPFNKDSRLDLFGIIDLSLMSAVMIYGITKAVEHASSNNSETIILAGIGLVLAFIYFVYNLVRKNQTVLPLNLFAHKSFTASSIGLFLTNAAIMGPMLILPLYFQNFRHFTATEAALALIPQGVGINIIENLCSSFGSAVIATFVAATLHGLPPTIVNNLKGYHSAFLLSAIALTASSSQVSSIRIKRVPRTAR